LAEDDAPKSAWELALERLRKKDRDEGVEERPLDDEQRTQISELRKVYEARLAEREILHHSSLRRAAHDPEAVEKLEEEYRRDRERIGSERDRKIGQVRSGPGRDE
jgi:hypothetical protein